MDGIKWEIAQAAAQRVVDDGMPWAAAKRHAAEDLGFSQRTAMPDNDTLIAAIKEHIAIYCAHEQAQALQALRELACVWMGRMAAFRPHLSGSVWLGIATHWSDIYLDLYCDDTKMPAIALLNQGQVFDTSQTTDSKGHELEQLVVLDRIPGWSTGVAVIMTVRDADDLRGAIRPDHKTGVAPRGDWAALQRLMKETQHG
jgi:hypothetical protein